MADLIDRQAAIDVIDKIFPADPMRNEYTQGITCGAALATEYIKQLPSAQPEKTQLSEEDATFDCISRQAAINTVHRMREIWDTDDIDDLEEMIVTALAELCPEERTETPACEDAVSRQAVLDAMDAIAKWSLLDRNGCHVGVGMKYRDVKETVKILPPSPTPSRQAEPHWIPCSERLPEESGRYLVTRGLNACGSLWNRIYIANYSDLMGIRREKIWWQGNVGKSDFKRLDDALAWTSLPEPYREGEG